MLFRSKHRFPWAVTRTIPTKNNAVFLAATSFPVPEDTKALLPRDPIVKHLTHAAWYALGRTQQQLDAKCYRGPTIDDPSLLRPISTWTECWAMICARTRIFTRRGMKLIMWGTKRILIVSIAPALAQLHHHDLIPYDVLRPIVERIIEDLTWKIGRAHV